MSERKSVLIRSIAEEYRLVGAQVVVERRNQKVQEGVDRRNKICNVVSANLKETQKA